MFNHIYQFQNFQCQDYSSSGILHVQLFTLEDSDGNWFTGVVGPQYIWYVTIGEGEERSTGGGVHHHHQE